MFKFRKAISALVATVMALSMMATSAFAAVPTDVIDTEYEQAAQVLGVLDIMVGDKDTGDFRPGDAIIRSEVTRVAISALGLQDVAAANNSATKYPDVVSNHWANGFINVATTQGLVIGDDVGTFRPDEVITYAEAVTILVRALGYEPRAIAKGGYPTGYLVTAADIGLTKGVAGSADKAITRGDVAKLTYNALTINLMEQVGFGSDINYEVVDKTLLSDRLDVEKITGQVKAVGSSSIDGSNLNSDQIKIANTIYKIEDADVREILGFNVDAYIKENKAGEEVAILVIPTEGKNEAITVEASDIDYIVNEESSKLLYYWKNKDSDKSSSKAVVKSDALVMYNGKTGSFADFKEIEAGTITLLDSDTDGKYDVIFVNETVNYVVDEVSVNNHKVTDKYGQKTLVLDPDNENLDFFIYKGSEKAEIKDLKEWDVLTVTKSKDGEFIYIEVSNEKVSGKVTETDKEKVFIDGKGYEIASNYPNTIKLEDEGTFYLDIFGKIAAVDGESTISSNYAYLINIVTTNDVDSTVKMKVFAKDGETKVLSLANKVRVNSENNLTAEQAKEKIGENGQLITFETNSNGKVHRVYTAKDTSGAIDIDNFSKNLTLSKAVFKKSANKLVASNGSVNVDSNTIVFDIPAGETDSDKFSIRDRSFFIDEDEYDVIAFDMQEDLTANVIIVTSSKGNADEASSIAVVDRITTAKDEDGMEIEKLYAYKDGELITLTTIEAGILVKEVDGKNVLLDQGDIIQIKTNANKQIESINLLFDMNSKGSQAENNISEDLATYYGKVVKKFTGSFNLQVNDGAVHNFAIGDAVIYNVDTTKNASQVTVGDSGDIQKYDEDDGSLVFVRVYKNVVQEIVVIK